MAEEPEEITQEAQEWYISLFGVVGPQHDSEARSEHRILKAPAKFREYEKDKKYFDPRVVSLGPYHDVEDHVTLSQMEESRGIASSPATGMAEDDQQPDPEPRPDPSEEWFISIFGVDDQQPDPDPRPKHRIPKVPTKFRKYENKKYFVPQVVSLGPYHHGEDLLEPMEKHKITAAKQFVYEFICETGERGGIYEKFMYLTGKLKECYDAEVVANMSDDVFAGMMFLDGCFVLHFIEMFNKGGIIMSEISNERIHLIIRDMFLIENQLPFEFLDALMNLRRGSVRKEKILKFIKSNVLRPMGMFDPVHSRPSNWRKGVDGGEHDRSLHLLGILRTILLDFPPSKWTKKQSYGPRYFGSVMELKEIGIRFEKRHMKSLMGIRYKENLLCPRLLLPTMYINETTISQLLNLTALEACSDTYSGCGVTSYIHFMDSIINDGADVKELRSKGILHHSLSSDDEVARLFKKWPADVMNDLELYIDIRKRIRGHRERRVKISIAKWLNKYLGSPWTAISLVAAVVLLVFTAIQTYLAAFPRR